MKNTQSESIAALAAALAAAQGMLGFAAKQSVNPHLKNRYADLASCIEAAKEPLSQNGLAIIQATDIQDGQAVLVTTLAHASGEWIKSIYPINPVKADPQGMGSAMTYARRYSLSAIIGLAADDDDGNAASIATKSAPPATKPAYTLEMAAGNAQAWGDLLTSGKATADKLIATISTKYTVPEEVRQFIQDLGK